jgi:hypothetical protein
LRNLRIIDIIPTDKRKKCFIKRSVKVESK